MVKKILIGMVVASTLITANVSACKMSHLNKSCNFKPLMEHSTTAQVIKAVSKTGLSAAQTKKIADGIADYEATTSQIKKMKIFPIDSFINDKFDDQKFIKEMSKKYVAAVAARAALFKYVFSVLDTEQRKIFKREYAAPLIEQIIKNY